MWRCLSSKMSPLLLFATPSPHQRYTRRSEPNLLNEKSYPFTISIVDPELIVTAPYPAFQKVLNPDLYFKYNFEIETERDRLSTLKNIIR